MQLLHVRGQILDSRGSNGISGKGIILSSSCLIETSNASQKGSQYLDDFNYFIDMRIQMGFSFEKNIELYIPNATKCWTWQDVKKSHVINDDMMVIEPDHVFGLIILLLVGLCGAMTILTGERLFKVLGF